MYVRIHQIYMDFDVIFCIEKWENKINVVELSKWYLIWWCNIVVLFQFNYRFTDTIRHRPLSLTILHSYTMLNLYSQFQIMRVNVVLQPRFVQSSTICYKGAEVLCYIRRFMLSWLPDWFFSTIYIVAIVETYPWVNSSFSKSISSL